MRAGPVAGSLLAAVAVALAAATFLAAETATKERDAPERAAARDLLLITVDTLRADALGFAGNRDVATPTLDRLAAGGRIFPLAHAHNVVTLPSHANILTGLYPHQHGIRDNSGFTLPAELPTLATLLRDAGFATGAFVGAFPLDARFGLDRGFEVYDDRYPEGSRPEEFVLPERRGDEVVERGLAWWQEHRGERRFLWLHLFDPHAPYAPPEPFASRYADRPYLGEVAATDRFLAPLLELLTAGGEPPVLVVFTADHGEALGDHGELTHGLFAYEPTLRVPLVLRGPGVEPGLDPRPARHVDLLPTVLDYFGVAVPPRLAGRSLLRPAPEAPPVSYFEALSTHLNRGWAPLRGVLVGKEKYLDLPLPELYDLAEDPGESRNLIAERPELARELGTRLPAESISPPQRGTVSAEEEARLESLGYVTGRAAPRSSYGPEDDPKRLLPLDRKIHHAIELYSAGRVEEAAELARELVAERPSMPVGYSYLAQALLEGGRTEEAVAVMRQARERGLASESLLRQLGLTLAERGEAEAAIDILQPLAEGGDPASLNALALAQSEAGEQDAALAALARADEVDPSSPRTEENLSLVYLRLGRWAEAREHARRAVELNDSLPRAWNNLGVALSYLGDTDEALAAWERVVALDPRQYDTLYNLGVTGARAGRTDRARWALRRFIETAPEDRYAADIREARALLARLDG